MFSLVRKMLPYSLIALSAAASTLPSVAWASDEKLTPTSTSKEEFTLENLPPLLKEVFSANDTIQKVFDTEVPGIQGWVMINKDNPHEPHVVYTFPDGKHGFSGAMIGFSKRGVVENLTPAHIELNAPKPEMDEFIADVENSHWIADGAKEGEAVNTIYGFFDANCIYCHLSWLALKPYMDAGLQIRWIPVAILGADSSDKAAALFQSSDPAKLMEEGHMRWEAEGRENAFPVASATPKELNQIDENNFLMRKLGLNGTPAFIYKTKEGKVAVQSGIPMLNMIPDITQMPEIKNDNPRLDRFR